ncbi:hypothetical protein HD554DRAFT_236159 [Boletus coccyginus]|nr:hypothetical protein HD554DRAFT_236159 [Boletus coccyginus]
MGTRLQSALYEGIRKERRCRHGLCVIRGRRCSLLYSTESRSFIGSPVDQAKQGTRWIVAGCQRGDQTPSPIEDEKMDGLVTELRTSSKTVESAIMLYDRVVVLPSPRLVSRRLSLSCVMFPLRGPLVASGNSPQRVYHTKTSALGTVEIKTTEDLSMLDNLVLVHTWLRCLRDPALPFEDAAELSPVDGDGDPDRPFTNSRPPSSYTAISPHHAPRLDKPTRALRLLARLGQPFGALLLVPLSFDEYKRVASDHPIVVQLLKGISPSYLAQKIRTVDIL